ncbi:unnamed protein product, partial [Discosporangium mesarthrocarpum]
MEEDLDRNRPLFNGAVAVQVKFPDHEKSLGLTVRVLQGSRLAPTGSGGGLREGVLHIELTDETDPFFLYTLQVGEEDYHQLKHEQCLRVDFKAFPQKFIELLKSCRSGQNMDDESNAFVGLGGTGGGSGNGGAERGLESVEGRTTPSFLARLETQSVGGCSTFSLIETNPFKELTHLSLRFRAGNDVAIKGYLAARLRQVKAGSSEAARSLAEVSTALAQERSRCAALSEETKAMKLDRDRDLRDLRTAMSAEITAAKEEGVRRAEEAAAARAAEARPGRLGGAWGARALRSNAEAEKATLSRRLSESESRREELTDLKFAHEAELRELRSRAQAGEGALGTEKATADALREENRSLEARVFEAEKEGQRLKMKVAALEQQISDAKDNASKTQALREASAETVKRLEETQEAYKESVMALQERLEASVGEINRGNAIIQRLQSQYRALKAKAKLKSEVIKQQERLVAEHASSATASESKRSAAVAERRAAEERAEGLKRELDAAEVKLEESARLLESNQQVITWLNRELNDAHLIPGAGAGAGTGVGLAGGQGAAAHLGGSGVGGFESRGPGAATEGAGVGVGVGSVMLTAGIKEGLHGGGGVDYHRGVYFGGGAVGDERGGAEAENTGFDRVETVGRTPDGRGRGGKVYGRVVTPDSG